MSTLAVIFGAIGIALLFIGEFASPSSKKKKKKPKSKDNDDRKSNPDAWGPGY